MRIQENMIEFSPLSIKGLKASQALSDIMKKKNANETKIKQITNEDDFLNEYYIPPFTRYESKNLEKDFINSGDREVYNLQALKKSKDDFENGLKMGPTRLIWLYGNAGCGKSTYVHKLAQLLYKESIKMNFYDFEQVNKSCILNYTENNYSKSIQIRDDSRWQESNLFRFIILLMTKIIECLKLNHLDGVDNNENVCVLEKIIKTHEDFSKIENEFESITNFFKFLIKIVNIKTRTKGIKEIANYFNDLVGAFNENENSASNIIKELAILLIYLLAYKGNIDSKPYIAVFDNIEYLISVEYDASKQLITDRTIEVILNSVHSAITDSISHLTKLSINPKIIIVTRKATVTFNTNLEMNNYQKLDITNWFCAKEIYEKRIALITQYLENEDRLTYDVFNIIMSDCTLSKWSLVPFLSKLFNYNIRRMARIILYVLSLNTATDNSSIKTFLSYGGLWEKKDQQELNNDQMRIKHFLRMFIIRLILDSFNGYPSDISEQNFKYFNKLMVETTLIEDYENISIPQEPEDLLVSLSKKKYKHITNKNTRNKLEKTYISQKSQLIKERQTSYARKILTILHRIEISQNYSSSTKSALDIGYYEIENLLIDLLTDGNTQSVANINDKTISTIADIIFLMNEVTDSTGWVPLTSIKWNNNKEKYTLAAINKILKDALSNVKNQITNVSYGIRITDAGQAFLQIIPDFEYFAARFCPNDLKLISNASMKKGNKGFPCIKTIKKVMFHAVKCAYTVTKRAEEDYLAYGANAKVDFKRMHNSKSIYKETSTSTCAMHPARIFNMQSSYLSDYYTYVQCLDPNEERFNSDEEKLELLREIQCMLDEYRDWQQYFSECYPDFFQWEE